MRKKVGVDTLRRDNGEKENQELPQTTFDKKPNSEPSELPLNGNHDDNEENFDEEEKEEPVQENHQEQFAASPNHELNDEETSNKDFILSGKESSNGTTDMSDNVAMPSDTKCKSLDSSEELGDAPIENTDISSDTGHESQIEPEIHSPNPDSQSLSETHILNEGAPPPEPEDAPDTPYDTHNDRPYDAINPPSSPNNIDLRSYHRDHDPPQHPVRFGNHQGYPNHEDYESRSSVHDHQPQNLHLSPQNLHQSPQNLHQSPQNLHQSPQNQPQNLHQSPAHPSPANLHQSPAHPGPLNLHQSPAHPGPSPTHSDGMPHPFQRPPSYHPPLESSQNLNSHLQNLQYSMSSQYPTYNHHYFNNANNNYNGQSTFMSSHGFPHNFSSESRGMAEQHEMYMNQSRAHESHHSSHIKPEFGHPGLGGLPNQFPRMGGQDPYSFANSDDELCSPNRGSGPFTAMGFSNMPMPLIAPKPKKPRKPRKPRSPKPDGILSMQMKEDSRSGDFSDMSFDDDGDGDGKLVIAEGDDLDIKMEGLGEDGKPEKKQRRKHNRFNGMSEEDVMKRLLPDLIFPDLDILIVGINPGLYAAFKQHHYAGPGNHFWKCLFLSGLIPRPMNADNDRELLSIGIGFTNIVERTTRASQELTRQEIEEGAKKLIAKIKEFNPKIAVFNGKGIYEVFSGQKEFIFGKQPEKIEDTDTYAWVMPNSSARCAQLPRAVDKVPFYAALKKFRDHLRGDIPDLDESEVVFPEVKLQNFNNKRIKREDFEEGVDGEGMEGEDSRIDPETGKKRRGRPPKPRPDGSLPAPKRRRVDEFGNPLPKGTNPIDPVTGKKKRGRPKKSDLPPQVPGMPNGMPGFVNKVKNHNDDDSDAPSSSSKTPTRLPPFSPNFARGGMPTNKDVDSDRGARRSPRPESARLHSSLDGDEGAKDLSRADSLPDLSGRLGDDPCSPPPSPLGKSLPPPEFEPPRSLHEEETSHSTEDRRPDSARSLTRPQIPCNFSNPTTPVDGHSVQNYQNQQHRFSPFPRAGAPHHSPNYPPGAQNFHAPYRSGQIQGTPPHQNYDSPQPRQVKPHDPSDVSTKSLTGLESLVDQIPAIAENDSGVFSGSGNGSHPPTPRSVGPYSPGQYHGGGSYLPPTYSGPQYASGQGPPGPGNTPGSDSFPTDLSTSTNYGHSVVTTASHSPATPSNFSVSSLAHSSVRGGGEENGDATITGHGAPPISEAFSVSNLASSYASSVSTEGSDMPPKYPPGIASNPYMSGISGNHSSMFGPGSLMSRSIGPPNSFMSGSMGSSMAGMAGMAGMGAMAGMAGMYGMSNYGQYSSAAGAYSGAAQAFAAAASGSTYPHGLHMPNPSYPYPSPYSQSPYSQSPYF